MWMLEMIYRDLKRARDLVYMPTAFFYQILIINTSDQYIFRLIATMCFIELQIVHHTRKGVGRRGGSGLWRSFDRKRYAC